nr:run domain Beclin-1-interacting and cysteine-rich domain-containing protein-like [Lytechinus pictus]
MSTLRPDALNDTTKETRYHEHYGLLWKLKATVESLLAANASNVWSMYGGLNRLANQLDVILKHGLKTDACPAQDYWNFVFGLRRIQPVLAPSIDQLSRRAEQEGRIKGLLWLQDSLENHTLSFQLRMLVSETSHLREFYSGSVSPACDGYFPQPSQGESLFTFLSSQDFATCPEVDKENAHFCISEAIIAAVEQIKCRQLTRQTPSDHESDGSDEEIQRLKQRIRLRRTEKRERKLQCEQDQSPLDCDIWSLEHDGTDSPQFLSDSEESMEEAEDFVVTDTSLDTNLVAMKTKGLTASLGSLYSDADLKKANKMHPIETVIPLTKIEPSSSHQLSAESIALSLIKKFSFRQLPAASELEWLVSEKDAPQQLLPLPKSVPISPDDGENADLYKNMRLRGNLEWAPPRPQIVFSIHPPPKRKQLIAKQNFRCAGCGMKAERGFLKRLRYCEYLGKYFCQCCHTNASSPIPSRILRKWDFSRYPVSNFSQELLSKIQTDPVFNVVDVNPILYRKVKQMQAVKDLRTQLFFLKDFLKTCRLCDSLKASYDSQPGHWMGQPDLYSLSDLINVRSGEMEKALAQLVLDGVTHVSQCQLCQAKGFVCELCNKDDIIFPFQLNSTFQCLECWACYHTVCFLKGSKCPKCERILARRGVSAVKTETSDEDPQSSSSS